MSHNKSFAHFIAQVSFLTDIPYLPDMEYLGNMTDYFQPLTEGGFYHIYNRGNNGDTIFQQKRNYTYFLNKLNDYVGNYLNFYAYSLLPNHFHFLVQVKGLKEIPSYLLNLTAGTKCLNTLELIISEEFRRFFLSYAKSIKVQEGRTGSLFEKNFKRKLIEDEKHLVWLVNYIHRNAETHGLSSDFRTYPFNSYRSFLSDAPTKLSRAAVLDWFGGKDEFIRFHETNPVCKSKDEWVIE